MLGRWSGTHKSSTSPHPQPLPHSCCSCHSKSNSQSCTWFLLAIGLEVRLPSMPWRPINPLCNLCLMWQDYVDWLQMCGDGERCLNKRAQLECLKEILVPTSAIPTSQYPASHSHPHCGCGPVIGQLRPPRGSIVCSNINGVHMVVS